MPVLLSTWTDTRFASLVSTITHVVLMRA